MRPCGGWCGCGGQAYAEFGHTIGLKCIVETCHITSARALLDVSLPCWSECETPLQELILNPDMGSKAFHGCLMAACNPGMNQLVN